MIENKRYYEVKTKCGHVKLKQCIWIYFAIVAEDGKEAAAIARNKPRAKHDHKDVIAYVKEITFEEYMVLKADNDADPFLHCKNIQEQRAIAGIEERIERDEWNIERSGLRYQKEKCLEYKHKKATAVRKGFDRKVREYFQEFAI